MQVLRGRTVLPSARLIVRRYYITDRESCRDVLQCIERAVAVGVDLIQIREKDLPPRELLALVRKAVDLAAASPTRVLVNGRVDVALAARANGVHLAAGGIDPGQWRRIVPDGFLIGVSCHSVEELQRAATADFAVYGPVFATPGKGPAIGLDALAEAARVSPIPLFALGGVTPGNAQSCIGAGAAGIAAIRMFQY
jgi:thiamine-phosphate pyrophosphorylase